MTFRRTDSGLSTMHLFLGVDAIVFVEGGQTTFTLEEVSRGSYSPQADDLKYWQIVFAKFAPGRKLHFRAVGSKNTIKEIGLLVASGKVTHVLVAMDRDFDHLNGSLPIGPGVFYTLGYSWENDVWTDIVVVATFKKFNTVPEAEAAAEKEIISEFTGMRKKLRHCVRADAMLGASGLQPLDRGKFGKIIRPVKRAPPTLSMTAARNVVREARVKARPKRLSGVGAQLDPLRDCYGHLLGHFGYHLLVYVLSKFCGLKTTPRELLSPAAIDSFSTTLNSDAGLEAHYSPMFQGVAWA